MSRRFSLAKFDSALAGLANYDAQSFNYTVTAHNLAAGGVSSWSTTWPLNNTDDITAIQVNFAGLETVWRPVSGDLLLNIPYVATQYQLQVIPYYLSGNLHVITYVINQTGGLLAVPQFFVNVRAFLYNAPF